MISSKIFGIGLSRTGTTSLHAALVVLGFPSRHYYPVSSWLAGDFRFDALADYDAVTDLPIPTYYPDLDRRYAASKFILTFRDPVSWLESCRRHWSRQKSSAIADGSEERRRNAVRLLTYGITGFDSSRFLHVYETHERQVLHYFRNRPEDLLVIDVTAGERWQALSRFLRASTPIGMPFPYLADPHIGRLASVKRDELEEKREAILRLAANSEREEATR